MSSSKQELLKGKKVIFGSVFTLESPVLKCKLLDMEEKNLEKELGKPPVEYPELLPLPRPKQSQILQG